MSLLGAFFNSGSWLAIRDGLLAFAIVLWLALGYWTYKDARRRLQAGWRVALSALVGLVPPYVGPFVYMLFRPPEYLEDVRERELEIKAIEERLADADLRCPVCYAEVEATYLVCPVCTTKLKRACAGCGAPLEAIWQVCPYCETPIEPAAPGTPPALGTRRAARRRVR
ncbi:MAG TPA: zinc ribbon domain-containing protein [Gaiellaceae bacterium]|nr:zinc ribbon domain-containing protein [Gaiellaceae bacterium]